MWPNKPPFRRAARWDGVFPIKRSETFAMLTPQELREVVAGQSEPNGEVWPAGSVGEYRAGGTTWWLEDLTPWRFGWEQGLWPAPVMRERVRQGPPQT